jgi:hypothetical protein
MAASTMGDLSNRLKHLYCSCYSHPIGPDEEPVGYDDDGEPLYAHLTDCDAGASDYEKEQRAALDKQGNGTKLGI